MARSAQAHRRRRLWRRFQAPRLFLPLLGAAYGLCVAAYVFVAAIDPFGLEPWGAPARLSTHPYRDHVIALLTPTATRDGTDLVVVGGSTSAGYMPAMLRAAFPDAKQPVNLSFAGASAADIEDEVARLAASRSLRRLVVSFEVGFSRTRPQGDRVAGEPPYDAGWYEPAPGFDPDAVVAALAVARTGVLAPTSWLDPDEASPDFLSGDPSVVTREGAMASFARLVDRSRPWVASLPDLPCAAFPQLPRLAAELKGLAARGVAVDVVLPPYSLALYGVWSLGQGADGVLGAEFLRRGSVFQRLVSARRCLVETMDGTPGVSVYGFDTDTAITGDLALYKDPSHIVAPAVYRTLLGRIAGGQSMLTAATWPAYEAALRRDVETYQVVAPPPRAGDR